MNILMNWNQIQIPLNISEFEYLEVQIQLYSMWIQFNWREMGCKLMEKVLKFSHEYGIRKEKLQRKNRSKNTLKNGLNRF